MTQSTAASLDAMLAQTVGAGKSQVLVYANMNVDQTTKESLEYGKAGTPLQQSKTLETLNGTGTGAGGVTGTANLTTAAAGAAGGKSNFKHESTTTSTSASTRPSPTRRSRPGPSKASTCRCCSTTPCRPPRCRRSAKPSPTPPASNPSAATRSRSARSPSPSRPKPAAAASSPIGYAKYALLALGAALFLFFTTRSLRKREKETIDEPVWLRELEAPIRLSELERETAVRPPAVMAGVAPGGGSARNGHSEDGGENIRRQVEQLVDSNPDRVAQQLRTWMQED